MFCGNCGGSFPAEDLANFGGTMVCANCKPAYVQRMREGGAAVTWTSDGRAAITLGALRYAGFWIRVLAQFIDGFIIFAVAMVIGFVLVFGLGLGRGTGSDAQTRSMVFVGIFYLVFFPLAILYQVWFISKKGGTPGKLALGLRIINVEGQNLSMLHALGRVFAHALSGLTLYIGYIIAAFDIEKRALHDHICKTHVIYGRT
jgi:uncharacterized RDD family membrane protein YckC